ncbi:hypothetical protein [Lacinutrix chionoecetis]
MKKIQLLYFIIIPYFLFSQDSIPSKKFESLKTNYKDFITVKNEIYAITEGDSLVIWDITSNFINETKPGINNIAKSKENKLFATTVNKEILSLNGKGIWLKKDSFHGEAIALFVSKNNKPVVLTTRGGYYRNNYYYPKGKNRIFNPRNSSPDTITRYLSKPSLCYLDEENRIWLTYDRGEFGQYTWFFDLDKRIFFEEEYLDINRHLTYKEEQKWNREHNYKKAIIDTFPTKIKLIDNKLIYKFPAQIPIYNGVKGIAEDKSGNIFISQSTHHFFISGNISIYSKTDFKNFYDSASLDSILDYNEHEIIRNKKKQKVKNLVEYLGPITFNSYNNSIYYYSNRGFFKLSEKDNGFSKELILKPTLLWKGGLSHSVGSQMAVKKFEFLDEKRFVFLTNLNGIGYFDGKQIKYYK